MPLVQITQFLILNMVVYLYTLFTGILQEIRNDRCNNLILDLVDTKRNRRTTTVISNPTHRADIQLHL